MMRKLVLTLIATLVLALIPANAAAGGRMEGRVVMGGDFTLTAGEVLDGDLVVLGGNVTIEEGSLVKGSVFLLGGNASVAGEIEGDLALLGGNMDLRATALVRGDVATLGGNLNRDEGAVVEGDVVSEDGVVLPFDVNVPEVDGLDFHFGPFSGLRPFRFFSLGINPLLGSILLVFQSLVIAALAVLVVMFWPNPTARAAKAVVDQPILAGGLGLLTALVVPVLAIVLVFTILLIPVSMVAALALAMAFVFGWIAIGLEVGKRLSEALKWDSHPAAAAGLGTLLLTFVVGGIARFSCFGSLLVLFVLFLGLGGVILTRFGSREYALARTTVVESPAVVGPETSETDEGSEAK